MIGMQQKKLCSIALLPLLFVLLAIVGPSAANNRARRFCCGTGSETGGGRMGCVVSQNKLFINGFFIKDLDEDEQQELDIYKKAQQEFKDQVHKYLEQRWNASSEAEVEKLKKPTTPKKPSFCSEKARTQYVFDGCVVQGDSVFIANQFVRKLSEQEHQQLQQFDQQFTSYQKAMSDEIRRRVQEAFGHSFGQLFGPMPGSVSGEGTAAGEEAEGGEMANSSSTTTVESAGTDQQKNTTLPEVPKPPEFCTLIV